jgi:formylmethanofuran dehydrogenase subunit E
MKLKWSIVAIALVAAATSARAETKEEWIVLGARVHGAFGAFIPVGIRIGEDARKRLKAEMRELSVTYHWGEKSPCPCIADGIAIAVGASAGQNTLTIAPGKVPGVVMRAVVRHRKTGEAVEYTVTEEWLPRILGWNRQFDPAGRYDAAMQAENLFQVAPAK